MRTYTGNTSPTYGPYSSVVSVTTASYTQRYVSPSGNNSNDGTAIDDAHAWRTLNYATNSARLPCGTVLIVKGGNYSSDSFNMSQSCSSGSKAVVMVNPGDTTEPDRSTDRLTRHCNW